MPCVEVAAAASSTSTQGSGDPVVLLHSSASSAAQWRALAGQLSERYRVLAPDLFGYGASATGRGTAPSRWRTKPKSCTRCSTRSAHRPTSSGIPTAARSRCTRRARGRPLPQPCLDRAGGVLPSRRPGGDRRRGGRVRRAVASGDYMGGCRHFYEYWSGPGSWDAVPPAKREAMAPLMAKVAIEFHAAFTEPAGLADHRRIAVPTLLVLGERSPQPTRRICELLAATLARCAAAHRRGRRPHVAAHPPRRGQRARRGTPFIPTRGGLTCCPGRPQSSCSLSLPPAAPARCRFPTS